MNGTFSRNIELIGNRLVIYSYSNENDRGTYVCEAFYDNGYIKNASIYINRIEKENILRPETPKVNLTPHNKENLAYNSLVRVDCDIFESNESNVQPYSIEWLRMEEEMSERALVVGDSLVFNR